MRDAPTPPIGPAVRPACSRRFLLLLSVLILLSVVPRVALGEHLECPACGERSACVPGLMAGRVVCAGGDSIVEYESVTAFCLSCHKPSATAAQDDETVQAPRMIRVHPMEVQYPRKSKTHRPIKDLYKGIRLTSGKVTCLSCHGGRDRSNHYVSTHPRHPRLCTQCHLK